jgi:hypothetical protein
MTQVIGMTASACRNDQSSEPKKVGLNRETGNILAKSSFFNCSPPLNEMMWYFRGKNTSALDLEVKNIDFVTGSRLAA